MSDRTIIYVSLASIGLCVFNMLWTIIYVIRHR